MCERWDISWALCVKVARDKLFSFCFRIRSRWLARTDLWPVDGASGRQKSAPAGRARGSGE
jgi:hypothetical protein